MIKKINNFIGLLVVSVIFVIIIISSLIIGKEYQFANIIFIPGSTIIFDSGFNEAIYNASNDYAKKYNKSFDYIIPTTTSKLNYETTIKTALDNGTETIIFSSLPVIEESIDSILSTNDYTDKNIIVIDESDNQLSRDYENVYSIGFYSSQATFVAGILSAFYLIANFEDANDWNIGGWGGLQIPPIVSLLSGLEQGINWFNYYFFGTDIYGNDVRTNPYYQDNSVESLLLDPGQKINLIDYNGNTFEYGTSKNGLITPNKAKPSTTNWYSNSYDLGEGTDKATGLINSDAKILIPIAGAQTADALVEASSYYSEENPIQILGMDTDAKDAYPNYTNEILFSVIKNVGLASYYSLWNAYNLNQIESESDYSQLNPLKNPFYINKSIEEGGWKLKEDSILNPNQNTYIGNFKNGGVGISDLDQNSKVFNSWINLFQIYPDLENYYSNDYYGFLKFIFDSFNAQKSLSSNPNLTIETKSYSFSYSNSGTFSSSNSTPLTNGNGLWVPFWDQYNPE